ncbi:hypothetical protein [Peptoniphilus harei]
MTLDKDSAHLKDYLSIKFADLVYDGKWYSNSIKGLWLLEMKSQKCYR